MFRSQAECRGSIAIGVEGSIVGSSEAGDGFTEELECLLKGTNYFAEGSSRSDDDIGKFGCPGSFFWSRAAFFMGPDIVNEGVKYTSDSLFIMSTD
jgi:hypothetical protein